MNWTSTQLVLLFKIGSFLFSLRISFHIPYYWCYLLRSENSACILSAAATPEQSSFSSSVEFCPGLVSSPGSSPKEKPKSSISYTLKVQKTSN